MHTRVSTSRRDTRAITGSACTRDTFHCAKQGKGWLWNKIFIYAGNLHTKPPCSAYTQGSAYIAQLRWPSACPNPFSFFVSEHWLHTEWNCAPAHDHVSQPSSSLGHYWVTKMSLCGTDVWESSCAHLSQLPPEHQRAAPGLRKC